jgi:hypothetical protein
VTSNSKHKNIFEALNAAQANMGKVVKQSENPHFRSSYADLADVMRVALPALTAEGICLWHKMDTSGETMLMVTTLTHGSSETEISCGVPLIVSKNDMQGMKSATTYAKRIGVESLTGIAPEDDDGNAAAKAPPPPPKPKVKPQIADDRRETLKRVFEGITKMDDLVALWETMTNEERVIFADMKDITKERLK